MAHPLLDRRDLTAQREQQPAPAPAYGSDELARLCAELAQTNRLLRDELNQERAELLQLCVTDNDPAQAVMLDFPAPGTKRLIVRRTGNGGSPVLAANTPALIMAPNDSRLGGQVVNVGANPVTLFLSHDVLVPGKADPLPQGAPQIVLNAAGGAWDLRLSNLLWCGSIVAVSIAGTTMSVAEV